MQEAVNRLLEFREREWRPLLEGPEYAVQATDRDGLAHEVQRRMARQNDLQGLEYRTWRFSRRKVAETTLECI